MRLKAASQKVKNSKKSEEDRLNSSILMNSLRGSSSKYTSTQMYHEMENYVRNYFLKVNSNPDDLKIFVTSNPKYHPMHRNEFNESIILSNSNELSSCKMLVWTRN